MWWHINTHMSPINKLDKIVHFSKLLVPLKSLFDSTISKMGVTGLYFAYYLFGLPALLTQQTFSPQNPTTQYFDS